jgi:high-affinity Fe2+/Pb2+ permease
VKYTKKIKLLLSLFVSSLVLIPSLAFGATLYQTGDALILKINEVIINPLILLFFGIAVIVFLYGVLEFIRNADSQEARQQGGRHILWGIVGIAIMMSVFGLMRIIVHTIGVPDDQVPKTIGL